MQKIAEKLTNHKINVKALPEIRWKRQGEIRKREYSMYFSSGIKQGMYGTSFILNKKTTKAIIQFEPINDRMCKIRLQGKFFKITIINVHAPTEETDDENVESLYDMLQVCDKVAKHDLLVTLGDFNAKIGQEESIRKSLETQPTPNNKSKRRESMPTS